MLKKSLALIALGFALSACSSGGDSNASSSDANPNSSDVAVRQDLMKDWRGANDILKGMQENPANFNADVIKEQANFLAGSTQKMWSSFSDASAKGKSQDAVWDNPTGFKEASDKFDAAVTALVAASQNATQLSDVDSAISAVGESCGSCHKQFKQR